MPIKIPLNPPFEKGDSKVPIYKTSPFKKLGPGNRGGTARLTRTPIKGVGSGVWGEGGGATAPPGLPPAILPLQTRIGQGDESQRGEAGNDQRKLVAPGGSHGAVNKGAGEDTQGGGQGNEAGVATNAI